jgi:hypothetical protein
MKKLFALIIVLSAFIGNAQRIMFGTQNNYVAPIGPSLPVIVTTAATDVTGTTATVGGNITSDGGEPVTSRGLVWGTSSGSSTNTTTSGTGTGSFSINLTGLSASTTYYVRAFATNSISTVYGSEVSFTTTAPVAAALTNQASFSWSVNQLAQNMPAYYLEASNLTLSQLPTAWTIQWTYKIDTDIPSTDGMHWYFQNPSTTMKYNTQMHLYQINGQLQFWYNGNSYAEYLMTGMTAGTIYKLAVTYDGTNLRTYSNGVLMSTFAINITLKPTNSTLRMGSNIARTMDEFRIWNSTLTAAEILANKDATVYGSSGLMLYYNFNNQGILGGNNTAVTSVTDQSGNSRNGTFYNVPLNSSTNNFVTSIVTGY